MSIEKLKLSPGEVIKKYRSKAKYTQPMLADELGINKNTIWNWENDKSEPVYSQIKWLVEKFDIPLYELFGMRSKDAYYKEQDELLTPYQSLSPSGKRLACRIIQDLLQHEMTQHFEQIKEESLLIGMSGYVAAAGSNNPINDSLLFTEPVFVKPTRENKNADVIMRVSGDSMEPNFHDGNRIYVQLVDFVPAPDTVVIAISENECYIKRVGSDRKLHSDNPNQPFEDRSEDSNVRVMGIVLGIVKDDDFYSKEDNKLLFETFSEDIEDFKEEHQIWD